MGNTRATFCASGQNLVVNDISHFDPTGIPLNGTGIENATENRFKYQNKESLALFGLSGVNDFLARYADKTINRFWGVDALSQNHFDMTSYHMVLNNPLRFIDPFGLDTVRAGSTTQVNKGDIIIFENGSTSVASMNEAVVRGTKSQRINPAGSVLAGGMLLAGALAADDITVIGIFDDPAIPVVVVGTVVVAGITWAGYEIYNSYNPDNEIISYHVPPKLLPGFPDAKRVPSKNQRARWATPDGKVLEWDSQHGDVEVYNDRGKHQGSADPNTGKMTKEPVKGRKTNN